MKEGDKVKISEDSHYENDGEIYCVFETDNDTRDSHLVRVESLDGEFKSRWTFQSNFDI